MAAPPFVSGGGTNGATGTPSRVVLAVEPAALEGLAGDAAAAGLRATQLEHEIDWLLSGDHGDGVRGAALGLYRGGALAAYVPFLHRSRHRLPLRIGELTFARLPFRTLQLFGRGVVAADDALVEPALAALANVGLEFEGVTLEEAPVESPVWRAIAAGGRQPFVAIERYRADHHVIELPPTYADYLARFSSKTRNTLGRKARKLASERGELDVKVYARPDEIAPLLRTIEDVVRRTYQYRLLGKDLTTANTALVRNFERWAARGWMRGYVLSAGGKPLAFVVGYVVRGRFFYEMPGYDPDCAAQSPGLVLLPRLIEDLITHKVADVVDFGAGDADYKRMFGTGHFTEVHALLVRRRAYAWSVAQLERSLALASQQGGRLLDRWQLKTKLKTLIRARARRGESAVGGAAAGASAAATGTVTADAGPPTESSPDA